MRLRRSLWLALAASVVLAVATMTIPAYIRHLDTRAEAELQTAAEAIQLPGEARDCQQLRVAAAEHCTQTTTTARQAIRDIPRQFRKLGLDPSHTYCHRPVAKVPESCIVLTQRRGYTLAVSAQGNLLPDLPLRYDGLAVSVEVFHSP